jgi:lysyl-tRNA synthetase class 2
MTTEQVADIRRQAAAWRGAEVERGFSMALGRFGDPSDADSVAVTAHHEGRLVAVLHFVPWGDDGLSLELMRRDRDADPGLNELMIVSAIRAAPDLGVTRLSLNFSAFRSALERGARLGAGPIIRAWRGVLLWLSRWFQIESLYRFNAKFRPVWETRYVCYPGAGDIPRIALAIMEVEGFLVYPSEWFAARRANRALIGARPTRARG